MAQTGLRAAGIPHLPGCGRYAPGAGEQVLCCIVKQLPAPMTSHSDVRSSGSLKCTGGGWAALQGKREASVDWQPALAAMQLSSEQLAAVLEARSTVTVKIQECAARRPRWTERRRASQQPSHHSLRSISSRRSPGPLGNGMLGDVVALPCSTAAKASLAGWNTRRQQRGPAEHGARLLGVGGWGARLFLQAGFLGFR